MLDARIFDLYDDPMPTRTDLEGYCGETAAALIQLAAIVLIRRSAAVRRTGRPCGCAQAITGLLLLLPLHRQRGQCYVPLEFWRGRVVAARSFLAGDDGPQSQRAVAAMSRWRANISAFEPEAATRCRMRFDQPSCRWPCRAPCSKKAQRPRAALC